MQMTSGRPPRTSRRALTRAALLASLVSAAPIMAGAVPTAPTVAATALGISSAAWTWSLSAGATGYRVLSATAPGTNISGDLPASASSTFTLTGLSTNTLVGVTVEAFGAGGVADAPASYVATLAADPTGLRMLGTFGNRVVLMWTTNGNPAGTSYDVNWTTSTNVGVLFSTAPAVIADSATATIGSLPGGQAINFQVRAVNSSGSATGFGVFVTTVVPSLANQPTISSATYANGVSSITWYWNASTGAIAYQLFSSSNGAVSPILSSATLSYVQTGLSTNTAYTDYVYAFCVPTSTSSRPFVRATLAAPTTGLTLMGLAEPPASGVNSPSETLSWGPNGNPADTTYEILWWSSLTSTVTVSSATTAAVADGLYGGSTLYFTVQAINREGIAANYDATFFSPGFSVAQSTWFIQGSRVLPVGYSGIVTFVVPNAAGTGSGVVTVQVTSGTFDAPVTLNVSTPSAAAAFPPVGGDFADLVSPIHLIVSALDANGSARQPLKPVVLTATYAPGNLPADGNKIEYARFDDARGVWIPLSTSRVGGALTAVTDHLSSFAVLSVAPARSVSAVTVGPNPLRPILNPGALMTFRHLPANARVRIFTYLGEQIVDMTADGGGVAAWNGRNHTGSFVASGVYIALIEGGGEKRTLRVAVER